MGARDEIEALSTHLRKQVSFEVQVVGVHDTHASGHSTDDLVVVGICRPVLARTHERRMREGETLEPQAARLARGTRAVHAHDGLHHRRDNRGRRHVLAGPWLIVEGARRLVEVPLTGLIEEFLGVLEVVGSSRSPTNLRHVGVGPYDSGAVLIGS